MPGRIRRPTVAESLASLALFTSLGGGAFAAASLPKNSVGTKQLRKNAVTSSRVADNTLTGNDVDEATLVGVSAARLDRVTYKTGTGTAGAHALGVVTATCDAGSVVTGGGVRVDDPANAYVV